MFKREVDLKTYLPFYLMEYKEISSIMSVENKEMQYLWNFIDNIYKNQFIETSGEEGIKRYEKIFSVSKKDDETLEDRRFNLLLKTRENPPYTSLVLRRRLEEICGKGMYSVEIDYEDYSANIKIALVIKRQFEAVKDLLKRMLPANISMRVIIMFNTNKKLSKYRHLDLTEMTHFEMRNKEEI